MSDKYATQWTGILDFAQMLRDNAANERKPGPQAGMVSVGGTVISPGVVSSPRQTTSFGWVQDASGNLVRASSPRGQALQRSQSKGKSLLEMVSMAYKAIEGLGQ